MIRRISEETGLSFNQVKDIALSSQFKFLTENMGEGEIGNHESFKNIMLRYLGTFKASPGKIKHMTAKFRDNQKLEDENA